MQDKEGIGDDTTGKGQEDRKHRFIRHLRGSEVMAEANTWLEGLHHDIWVKEKCKKIY